MLLKHRAPEINTAPVHLRQGLEHLDKSSIEILRWLNAIKLDYVVVGPMAHAIRGDVSARGPVAIVPAPYGRNFERLASALVAQHAGLRSDRGVSVPARPTERGDIVAVKLTGDKLARGRRWMLRFGGYDLDVEGAGKRAAGARATPDGSVHAPGYQELLYEAGRFQLAEGICGGGRLTRGPRALLARAPDGIGARVPRDSRPAPPRPTPSTSRRPPSSPTATRAIPRQRLRFP